jgi:transcriptional regulator of met regulon
MANPPGNPNQDARDHRGHYVRTLEAAERDAEAARLHAHGYTDGMIAVLLGYPSARAAGFGRRKILAEIERAPVEEIIKVETQKLDLELVRLEELERTVRRVLDAEHITVSNGNVITDPRTGQPLADDDPLLRAADRLIKIEDARRRNAERRAKLLGLDAEQKVSVSGSVRYEVVGVNPEDLT